MELLVRGSSGQGRRPLLFGFVWGLALELLLGLPLPPLPLRSGIRALKR